jgi:Fic family protein
MQMGTFQRPPKFDDLVEEMRDVENSSEFIMSTVFLDDSEYRHWNKIRHMTPPGRLTHRQWWYALKHRRSYRCVGDMLDAKYDMFIYGQPDPIPEQLHEIDMWLAGRVGSDDSIDAPNRDRYIKHSLREEAIRSSQIEGAATTRRVAKDMLRTERKPRDENEKMILNNYHAMQWIQSHRSDDLTVDRLLELHRILTADTLEDSEQEGRFRRSEENIEVATFDNEILHIPPPADQLGPRMEKLIAFANDLDRKPFIHPVIRAIILHFWMGYEHPFCDGNGRCARALFYWSMLRQGYWMAEYISISSPIRVAFAQYRDAYRHVETDDGDLTYFILFHLKMIMKAMAELQEHIEKIRRETQQINSLLQSSSAYNHRQIALLGHALRHPDQIYTVTSHQNSHNVVHQTARTDLYDLADRGLLVKFKRGRSFLFKPADELQRRMGEA